MWLLKLLNGDFEHKGHDLSVYFLILSNLVTIFLAVVQQWNFFTLLWVYWFQSVTIGIFQFIKIWRLKKFSTENFEINNQSVNPTEETKRKTAVFFAIHYGGFHFFYLIFILVMSKPSQSLSLVDVFLLAFGAVMFFINHLFSYNYNRVEDEKKKKNIGSMMFFPYIRIVPMHLTIIFAGNAIEQGSTITGLMVLFLLLKTAADAIMHWIEHRKPKETLNQ